MTPLQQLTLCLQAALELAKVVSPSSVEMIGKQAQEALDQLNPADRSGLKSPDESPPPNR